MSGDALGLVVILAALGILLLLAYGGEDRRLRADREGFEEGPAQALVAAPVASDPEPVITVVEEQGRDSAPLGRSRTAE